MYGDLLDIGDRATWRTINGERSGIVIGIDDQGVMVAIDGGGVMLLSTTHSIRWAAAERKRRQEENSKPRSTK